jgi:hypothetical protein
MFDHLDDNSPHRTGTAPQLAAVRNRARQISSERRRNKLALGSVTLAATAVVSGAAAAGSLTGSGTATGQAGTGGIKPADPKAVPGTKPALGAGAKKGIEASADAAKASKLAAAGLTPATASEGPVTPKPTCDPTLPSLARVTAPAGYSVVDGPNQVWAEYAAGGGATVTVKVTCSPLESSADMAKEGWTAADAQFDGHAALQWTHGDSDIGVGWATKAGAIYIKAAGPAASRLTLAELEAFAATVPTAS